MILWVCAGISEESFGFVFRASTPARLYESSTLLNFFNLSTDGKFRAVRILSGSSSDENCSVYLLLLSLRCYFKSRVTCQLNAVT